MFVPRCGGGTGALLGAITADVRTAPPCTRATPPSLQVERGAPSRRPASAPPFPPQGGARGQ